MNLNLHNLLALPFVLFFVIISCEGDRSAAVNKFSDPVIVKIADLKDRRLSDSLYTFLRDEDPRYRIEAALAYASIQDTAAIHNLLEALHNETKPAVRKAIAFSLGQMHHENVAEKIFTAYMEDHHAVLRESLESFGKSITVKSSSLKNISPILGGTDEDSIITEGKVWGIYRLALRRAALPADTPPREMYPDSLLASLAITYLDSHYAYPVRLAAAHVLARGRALDLTAFDSLLVSALQDPSPEIRMCIASAYRKVKPGVERIQNYALKDADYRVRVNAVKALQSFSFKETYPLLVHMLSDSNINVAIAASEVIRAKADSAFAEELADQARTSKHWRIQANLFEASLSAEDDAKMVKEICSAIEATQNPYQKAALITALQPSISAHEFIGNQILKADTPVVRSAAAGALVSLNYAKSFTPSLKIRFLEQYIEATRTGDPAVIGIVAGALADSTLGYIKIVKDARFLYEARERLSLPKDNEALQPLEAAIAYLEGKKNFPAVENEFNHPIDWDLVKVIPADQRAVITTTKGDITIRLLVEEAPGSVANFVALANAHYFDKKLFHRAVPNFVIQAGCNRGDGWGSEDYSIRSEFSPRRYKAGSVGMASAGKDTEGTQWFITHAATPHLDGRYTIFAEVEQGMDVVHNIEVGDQILAVTLK